MTAESLIKLFGAGGGFLVMVALCFWMIRYILREVVGAVQNLRRDVQEHTQKDLAHHAEVKIAVMRIDGRLEGILDQMERTDSHGIPSLTSEEITQPDAPSPIRGRFRPQENPVVSAPYHQLRKPVRDK